MHEISTIENNYSSIDTYILHPAHSLEVPNQHKVVGIVVEE